MSEAPQRRWFRLSLPKFTLHRLLLAMLWCSISFALLRGTTPEGALRQLLESSTASPSAKWEKRRRRK